MSPLSEVQVLHFLIQFTLMFVLARLLADVMKRLGQATVIGELLAGIILGPSLLGHFAPGISTMIFPPDQTLNHLIEGVSWIGIIMLLLYTGLETDLNILQGMGRRAAAVSLSGIVVPLTAGFGLGWITPASYLANPNSRLIFSLFMAVAMSISAVPVIAKILLDLDLMRRDLGLLILASGLLDDTIGWLLLSVVAGLAAHGTIGVKSIVVILITVSLFMAFCYYVAGALVVRVMRWVDDRAAAEHAGMSMMVGLGVIFGIITQAIGIHAVFGAFIAGVMLGRSTRLRRGDRIELEAAAIGVFAPIFFSYSGLKVDLFAMHGVGMLGLVLAIAVLGKLIGCTAGGLATGLRLREGLTVAAGMNARGGMEIIVATIGLSLGVLTAEMYAVIVMVAIVTSLMTPPLLNWLLAGVKPRPEETERLEREKLLARLPFSKEGAKLLVLNGGGPHAQLAAHIAASLGNHHDATITVFNATTSGAGGKNPGTEANFERIKAIAEMSGARNVIQRSGTADTIAEAIIKESDRGYDAIFAGAARLEGDYTFGSEVLQELVTRTRVPLVIARNTGSTLPLRRILVPITGASFSRLGASVALLYTMATACHLTALYVAEEPPFSFSMVSRFRRRTGINDGVPIADEIRELGKELGVEVEPLTAAAAKPETAILSIADKGEYDLIIMGTLCRAADNRLYFGPKVEHILSNARCALAVVVAPERTW
ncbi:MAG TPA: cation:proton antiporter [Candidatus Binataceae bacterium]|nr:cation:proton antiporter [Candidatus Binataceae bacterium]